MTHIWSISGNNVHASDFSLKAVIKVFLLHADLHDVQAGHFTLTEFKASHDQLTGYWEETKSYDFWIDPIEGFDAIYEAMKNV